MGKGYVYKCNNCNNEYTAYVGCGMLYPDDYRKKLSEIVGGAYGAKWQSLLKKTELAAINADKVIYVCSTCNRWEEGTDVTLYAPKKPESILHMQYGDKTVEKWGHVPWVTGRDLKENYRILKRYYHKCVKCGKRMHKASDEELWSLPCPKCGAANEILPEGGILFWD